MRPQLTSETKECPHCSQRMIGKWGEVIDTDEDGCPTRVAWVWWCRCGEKTHGGVLPMHIDPRELACQRWEKANPAKPGRHLRMIWIRPDEIVTLFMGAQAPVGRTMAFPVFEGIPPDAPVVEVHYSAPHAGFLITLEHPSFADVPPGTEVPVVFTLTRMRKRIVE